MNQRNEHQQKPMDLKANITKKNLPTSNLIDYPQNEAQCSKVSEKKQNEN